MTMALAIIPARGGSKRLPGKNIKKLNGKPLIGYTIDVASKAFDRVVFTSDDKKIIKVAQKYVDEQNLSNVDIEKRPDELATDTSKVIDTVEYYYEHYGRQAVYHQIWLLLPTCPLRTLDDALAAKKLLKEKPMLDGVLSITDPEFPPSLGLIKDWEGLIKGLDPHHPFAAGNSRSQDQAVTYRPNGAFYGMWWESFRKYKNFYRGRVEGYHMPRERSIDIDNEIDFIVAKALLKK